MPAQKNAGIQQIIAELKSRMSTYRSYLDQLAESGENQISLTDPDSRLMRWRDNLDVSYNVQTAVDAKNKLVAEFAVTNQAIVLCDNSLRFSMISKLLEKRDKYLVIPRFV